MKKLHYTPIHCERKIFLSTLGEKNELLFGLHLHDDALVGHQVVRTLVVHFEEEVVGATGEVGREGEMELG